MLRSLRADQQPCPEGHLLGSSSRLPVGEHWLGAVAGGHDDHNKTHPERPSGKRCARCAPALVWTRLS